MTIDKLGDCLSEFREKYDLNRIMVKSEPLVTEVVFINGNNQVKETFDNSKIEAYSSETFKKWLDQWVLPKLVDVTTFGPSLEEYHEAIKWLCNMKPVARMDIFSDASAYKVINHLTPAEIVFKYHNWKEEIHLYDQVKTPDGEIGVVVSDIGDRYFAVRLKNKHDRYCENELTRTGKNFREQFEWMFS